jgi:hypothetical protein
MTALSLAGNIVQFVDFSCEVISRARELSRSIHGSTQEAFNYEVVARDLLRLSENLEGGHTASNADRSKNEADQALEDVCNRCIILSEAMLKRLEDLKVQDNGSRRRLLGRALKSTWSQRVGSDGFSTGYISGTIGVACISII